MFFIVAAILFFLGLAIGSFLHVVIYRTVNKESYVTGRSHCPHCDKQIDWYDNIPLVSFLILQGKCRHCHKPIAWSHPMIELITGLLFVWWYFIGFTFFRLTVEPLLYFQRGFWLAVGICLIVVFFSDILYGYIPNIVIAGLTFFAIVYRSALFLSGIMQPVDFWSTLIAATIVMLFFFALHYFTKGRGMGMGDVKFVFPLGLVLGWPNILVALFAAFISGSVIGVVLVLTRRSKMSHAVPFGPFLVFGTVFGLFLGDPIVRWYLTLLH
jgi:prepilin signal peptidase PulO-like enzyme (type II secretory pathway)